MSTSDQTRIVADAAAPLIAQIWRALQPLRSVVGFMNTGAHPDDEMSGMLAALGLRDGLNLSYACANRGEGGQNDIGTEAGFDLGVVRTAEMERACDVLDMRLYWLGQMPDDTITDFGFSKSGEETLGRWGHDRTLRRFVDIVRMERPDILCVTFLDVPGQHGHHRAMTQAAHEVMDAAADPSFVGSDLPVWQPSKLYLPAFSGAGGAYDDEVPPPEATLTVSGTGIDPVLGNSYARIGQQSRAFHRTQGMGRWIPAGAEHDWPLHLADTRVGADAQAVTDNLPQTLGDLGLDAAQVAIEATIEAFPDRAAMLTHATRTIAALADAQVAPEHAHRVTRKQMQLARIMRLCAHPNARASVDRALLPPGEATPLNVEHRQPDHGSASVEVIVPHTMTVNGDTLLVSKAATTSDPYPDTYDPLAPPAPSLAVTVTHQGTSATSHVAFETPPLIAPTGQAQLSVSGAILNLAAPGRTIDVTVSNASDGALQFDVPQGWQQSWIGGECTLTLPDDVPQDLYALPLTLNGKQAQSVTVFQHDHIAPRLRATPAQLNIRVTEIALPQAKIAYIGAGNDQAATWLRSIGCDVTDLDDPMLATANPFDGFDTVLIGVFAMRFQPNLLALMPSLHAWAKAGGNLVTLYHRPWDLWDPDTVPPARLEIGQPSLRWRVTDETAEVTHLAPEHPILRTPNAIGIDDWRGWHKERGLYFAKSWDAAYTPLLSMSDAGEDALHGALLSAQIGRGRHTHVALILHHQMAHLVPGAYRLMANILAP